MLSNGHFTGFNTHPRYEGSHAILSPSNYHWLNYSREKLLERLRNAEAAAKGTRLHDTAARCIADGIELKDDGQYPILAAYVNDAIELDMQPERMLYFSPNCFGTADAISFDEFEKFLRIHDLKTGVTKAGEEQLYIYAAIFCLEYGYSPFEINGELRIYQGDVVLRIPIDRLKLAHICDKIVNDDDIIENFRMGDSG